MTQKQKETREYLITNIQEIKEMWFSPNFTVKEIANKYNVSTQVITRFMKPYGKKKSAAKGKFKNTEILINNVQEIKEMWEGDFSYKDIQEKYNIGLRPLQRFAKENNFGPKKKPNKNTKSTTQEFIKKAKEIHGDQYIYDSVNYTRSQEKVKIQCPKHGIWYVRPDNHLHSKSGCPKCLCSQPEKELIKFTEEYAKIEHNNRSILNGKEIDIYIPDFKLGIEFNGLMFHSIGSHKSSMFNIPDTPENRKKHLVKTDLCEKQGIQLLHIFENEWINETKKKIWKSVVLNKLKLSNRIPARKTQIKELTTQETKLFLEENHLQGYTPASIRYGLFYGNDLVSLITLSKGRNTISGGYEYELIRFCNKINTTVIGGASKLFKYFIKKHQPKNIVSFANRRWSDGSLYYNLGFRLSHISDPNYFYFKPTENILYSRNKFQKHKLKDLLIDYDPEKTEFQNMDKNGYRKIYDSGNYVFVWEERRFLGPET